MNLTRRMFIKWDTVVAASPGVLLLDRKIISIPPIIESTNEQTFRISGAAIEDFSKSYQEVNEQHAFNFMKTVIRKDMSIDPVKLSVRRIEGYDLYEVKLLP